MRLEPIEKPPTLLMRIGNWLVRRQFGKVPLAFRVIYGRAPKLAPFSYRASRLLEGGLSLDRGLVTLVMTHASRINGCGFCADLHLAQAVQAKLGKEKFDALGDFRTSPLFDDRERAALAYCEEASRRREVGDATFAELQKHFAEREIVELTWVNAVNNYFNLLAVPLGIESDGLAELALQRSG
jgi:AhpD family alkylhydroperoxidase